MGDVFDIDTELDKLARTDLSMTGPEAESVGVKDIAYASLADTPMPEEAVDLELPEPVAEPEPAPKVEAPPAPEPPAVPEPVAPPPVAEPAPKVEEPAEVPEWDGQEKWEDYLTKMPQGTRKAVDAIRGRAATFQQEQQARVDGFLQKGEGVIKAFAEARGLEVEPVLAEVTKILQGVYQSELDQAEQRAALESAAKSRLTAELQLLAYQDQSYAQAAQRSDTRDKAAFATMAQILNDAGRLGQHITPARAWNIARAQHGILDAAAPKPAPTPPVTPTPKAQPTQPPPVVAQRSTQARPSTPPSQRRVDMDMGDTMETALAKQWAAMFGG